MSYAEKTTVSVSKTKADIEKQLTKHGASSFGYFSQSNSAIVVFEIMNKRIKISLPLPDQPSDTATSATVRTYEQLCRSKWRALFLCIKSKLTNIEIGIATLEQEFMPHIMLPNGQTVGEVMIPQIERSYKTNEMPPLLIGKG